MNDSLFPVLVLDPPPQRAALRFPDRSLTYVELRAAAMQVARAVAEKRRVAVLAESRLETCVGVIGALLAGTPVVPINPKSGRAELEHIIRDADPDVLLIAPGADKPKAFGDVPTLVVDLTEVQKTSLDLTELSGEAPALVVYTSGTTGPPKGAVLPRRAIATNLDALAQVWQWTDHDVVAHALPLFHVHGLVLGILGAVHTGGAARHLGRFSPTVVAEALDDDATILFGVPTMYRRLAEAAEQDSAVARA
ncbi:MAG: AMP-binding protein, partial [Alphaproteobacteria bacterium]|nr:AMP-binding protein [Alphaproteobacteria bacterium]